MTFPYDGGPAFPQKEPLTDDWSGMTLRDWFAGQALAGMLANQQLIEQIVGPNLPQADADLTLAAHVFSLSDAMIAARDAGGAS